MKIRQASWLECVLTLLGLLIAMSVLWGWGEGLLPVQAAPSAQAPDQPPSARMGEAIYQQNCAACHGSQGQGDGPTAAQLSNPVPALADPQLARQASPSEWFQVVKEGRMDRLMPPWKDRLSDAEIWNVVAYAYSLHLQEGELDRGEQVWAASCAGCHGEQGAGDGPQAASQGLQMPDLSDTTSVADTSLQDWFEVTASGRGAMSAFADKLSEEDLWAALEYARAFSYRPLQPMPMPKGEGHIIGQLENGTPAGGSVAGLTVTLRSFQHFDEMRPQTTQADEEGRFEFNQLPTAATDFYLVTTEYQGVTFTSDLITFDPDSTQREVTLTVWEKSTTPGDISVSQAQWLIEPREGLLLVGELYQVKHESDAVYVGDEEVAAGRRAVLRFELPPGVTSISIDGGEIGGRFILNGNTVIDTEPLLPGETQILMRYLLPYRGTRAELAHALNYPVAALSVLVPEGSKVGVEGLQEAGMRTIGDQQWQNFEGSNLPAGRVIRLKLRGLPRAARGASPHSAVAVLAYRPTLLYGLSGLTVVVVFGLLAWMVQRGGQPPQAAPEPTTEVDPAAQQERLLRAIAALDDSFAAGDIDERSYQEARRAYKRALLVATRRVEDDSAERALTRPGAGGQA